MTLYDIFGLASYIAGKFPQGAAFTPDRFNQLINQVQGEWYVSLLNELIGASGDEALYSKMVNASPLRPFIKTDTLSVDGAGLATLPTDYGRYLVVRKGVDYSGTTGVRRFRKLDIVSPDRFAALQGDVFVRPDVTPFGKIDSTGVLVVPFDVAEIIMDYAARWSSAYMDYCVDAAAPTRVIYMPIGSYIQEENNVNVLRAADNSLLFTGVYKAEFTGAKLTSTTTELLWESIYLNSFVYKILEKVGINLAESDVAKYAIAKDKA